jgi:hypothetical protein
VSFDIGNKTNTTCIMLKRRIVKPDVVCHFS